MRLRAGTPVAELDAALAERGQLVAAAGLGARSAACSPSAAAACAASATGPVRDTLLQAGVVTADGQVVKAGGPDGQERERLRPVPAARRARSARSPSSARSSCAPGPARRLQRWFRAREAPTRSRCSARLYRPAAVLWDGTTTWVLLEGHPADVRRQAAAAPAGARSTGPPPLPPHRSSVPPASAARPRRARSWPRSASASCTSTSRAEPAPAAGGGGPPPPAQGRASTPPVASTPAATRSPADRSATPGSASIRRAARVVGRRCEAELGTVAAAWTCTWSTTSWPPASAAACACPTARRTG